MSDCEPSTSGRRFFGSGVAAIGMGAPCHAVVEASGETRPTTPAYSDLRVRVRTPSKQPRLFLEASYQKGDYDLEGIEASAKK
jgi:hypothetical protein